MKVTKLEHAALILEKNGRKLAIDPGSFTLPFVDDTGFVAVVITHEHADHWTPEHLDRLLRANPGIPIYGPQGVVDAAAGYAVTKVADGDVIEAEPFELKFFGEKHAVIHSSIPVIDNVGVLVDDTLYYPGDSYTVPPVQVDTLAAPSGAPWLKIGDAMDFVLAVKPKRSFTTHQMVLSKAGQGMTNARIQDMTEKNGGEFFALEPGDTLEL